MLVGLGVWDRWGRLSVRVGVLGNRARALLAFGVALTGDCGAIRAVLKVLASSCERDS
jgi:hypothetical protein